MNLIRCVMCSNHNLSSPNLRWGLAGNHNWNSQVKTLITWFRSNGTSFEEQIARLPLL